MRCDQAFVCGAVCLVGLVALPATAMFAVPPEAPVDRLIHNVGAYVKEHPDEAMGYYTLARVHHLAFALKQEKLRALEQKGQLPTLPAMFNVIPAKEPSVTDKALREHLLASLENYGAALSRDADNPLFHLGMARRTGIRAGDQSGASGDSVLQVGQGGPGLEARLPQRIDPSLPEGIRGLDRQRSENRARSGSGDELTDQLRSGRALPCAGEAAGGREGIDRPRGRGQDGCR
jgi:hypothetical protein